MNSKQGLTKIRQKLDKLPTDTETGLDTKNWTTMGRVNPQFREFTLPDGRKIELTKPKTHEAKPKSQPKLGSLFSHLITPNRVDILTRSDIHNMINKPR
jgi:hypothetical protein